MLRNVLDGTSLQFGQLSQFSMNPFAQGRSDRPGPPSMQLPRSQPLPPVTGQLELRFWGTRGSIPVSGAANLRYGGNTSCVSLTSESGHLFVFDCGSGARDLGNYLLSSEWAARNPEIKGYLLLSHTHWDHIQGFPFFAPVFKPNSRFNIIGWHHDAPSLSRVLAGQMEQNYFPVSLNALPSELAFYVVNSSQPAHAVELDGAKLTCCLLKHPLPSIGYRLELGGKTLVYATDHEPHDLPPLHMQPGHLLGDNVIDAQLVKLARHADVLIHDAQYSNAELFDKVGWGHNTAEIAADTAVKAGVKTLILYHHDPAHDDDAIDRLVALARQRAADLGCPGLEILAASDGLTIKL